MVGWKIQIYITAPGYLRARVGVAADERISCVAVRALADRPVT